jgi:hypothetical protein
MTDEDEKRWRADWPLTAAGRHDSQLSRTLVVGFGLVHSALPQEPTAISTIVARITGAIIRAL